MYGNKQAKLLMHGRKQQGLALKLAHSESLAAMGPDLVMVNNLSSSHLVIDNCSFVCGASVLLLSWVGVTGC